MKIEDSHQRWLGLLLICLLACPAVGRAQTDRRRVLRTPGLVLRSHAPLGITQALRFTDDGRHLLVAGNDKVVRQYQFENGRLQADPLPELRWATWREERGMIYALALSPVDNNRLVALSGYGLRAGTVVIIDRRTGQVRHAVTAATNAITALAFSPSGKSVAFGTRDGSVHLWPFDEPGKRATKLGTHTKTIGNSVHLLAFTDDRRLISAANDGTVFRWSSAGGSQPQEPLFRFDADTVPAAEMAGNQEWIAAAGETAGVAYGTVELRDLNGRLLKRIKLRDGAFVRALAAGPRDRRLALSVDLLPAADAPFEPERSVIFLHDTRTQQTRRLPVETTYVVDSLAFTPNGRQLVIAGGENYELTVCDSRDGDVDQRLIGPGRGIWGVGLSEDGRFLGLRNGRQAHPRGFNDWGTGLWRVLDLKKRDWMPPDRPFKPVASRESAAGYRVVPDRHDRAVWNVAKGDMSFSLPLDRLRDGYPRCFTFLEPEAGKPVQLAVGHRFGVSLFELGTGGARRVRLFVGHADDVTSLGLSADESILVSASRDQTVSAWSLAPWPHQRELGVRFEQQGRRLLVGDVAAGSPGWEAGLTKGDQLVLFAFNGRQVSRGAPAWLARLRNPVPGLQFYFRVRRGNQADPIEMQTTVRQRPLWRFFATQDDEWVLWRWRDFFYDTSTRGDSFIGWQINGDVDETPEFHEAEKFRERFHQPDKIANLIDTARFDPERVAIPELLPPKLELTVLPRRPGEAVAVRLKAVPRKFVFAAQLREVALWINDHKLQRWTDVGENFEKTVAIPNSKLRSLSENRIIAQAYNRSGVRGDSTLVRIRVKREGDKPRLLGLCIGISDYSRAARGKNGRVLWSDLFFAAEDARSMTQAWQAQGQADLFADSEIRTLLEGQATRTAILQQLRQFALEAKPDDVFVLFLAGHGYAKKLRDHVYLPRSFAFACPKFDIQHPETTGVGGRELYEALAALPCRKLVLLDCCHSGSTNVLRELAPEGIGPIMMMACSPNQESYDIPFLGHGAFSSSILEAMGEKFSEADGDGDALLRVTELSDYTARRVPQVVELAQAILGKVHQTPQTFIPRYVRTIPIAAQNVSP